MSSETHESAILLLSICITTFNRGAFIGATLDSILEQMTDQCEVVVLDGGSTDDTEQVISTYRSRHPRLRYIKQESNNGFDRDCDLTVQLAGGEYCWLMPDDDLLKPGAVETILTALRRDLSLVIVNAEAWDFKMTRILQRRWLDLATDREYEPQEVNCVFADASVVLPYVGSFIVKRSVWLSRDKERYYDTLFVYLGVIFQQPLPGKTLVIAEPLIRYRRGNAHTWSPKTFEAFMVVLPSLLPSFPLSDAAKSKVGGVEPWRSTKELLLWRGLGFYSLTEYRQLLNPRLRSVRERLAPILVALIPGTLLNALFLIFYTMTGHRYRGAWQPELVLQLLKESRFHIQNWGA